MSSQAMHQIIEQIEADVRARPSGMEFEMAYQARVAMDRIRFALEYTEQFAPRTDPMREASMQLLDALERFEGVDRRFQDRSGDSKGPGVRDTNAAIRDAYGHGGVLDPFGRA